MRESKERQRKSALRLLSLVTNIGLTTTLCLLIGVLSGYYLDRWLGTSPLFLIILTILGIAAAFKNIYDIARKIK